MIWDRTLSVTPSQLTVGIPLAEGSFRLPLADVQGGRPAAHGVEGELPPGLHLEGIRDIEGVPTEAGSFQFEWVAIQPAAQGQEEVAIRDTIYVIVDPAEVQEEEDQERQEDPPPKPPTATAQPGSTTTTLTAQEEMRRPYRSIYEAAEQAFQDDLSEVHNIEEELRSIEALAVEKQREQAEAAAQFQQELELLQSRLHQARGKLTAQVEKTFETLDTLQDVQGKFRSKYQSLVAGDEEESS